MASDNFREMFLFHVELAGLVMRPGRLFLLDAGASFADLHRAIQDAFGWENRHLWSFRHPNGNPIVEGADGEGRPIDLAARLPLASLFDGEKCCQWCHYTYDFGDDWVHEVKLVSFQARSTPFRRELVDGLLACPPEDRGGAPGYENLLQFLVTGKDELMGDPSALAEWIGDWDPDHFDPAKAAKKLNRKRLPAPL